MGLWAWLNLPLPCWPHNPYSRYEAPQVVRLYRLRCVSWFTVDNSCLQEGDRYVTGKRGHVGGIYLVVSCGCGLYRVRWGGYYGIVRRGFVLFYIFLCMPVLYCVSWVCPFYMVGPGCTRSISFQLGCTLSILFVVLDGALLR